eukprot:22874_6
MIVDSIDILPHRLLWLVLTRMIHDSSISRALQRNPQAQMWPPQLEYLSPPVLTSCLQYPILHQDLCRFVTVPPNPVS